MRGKRYGCITGLGGIAALLTILVVGGLYIFTGGEMFSPGPLSAVSGQNLGGVQSHAEIGGRCELCHAPPWDAEGMAGRCLSCHTSVETELVSAGTLHSALMEQNPTFACRDCHPEHRGNDAPLTEISGIDFPHDVLGFSLAGHAEMDDGSPFDCGDCHGDDISTFDPAECQTCHTEIEPEFTQAHIAWTGIACLDCHDGVDVYGREFDHSATRFALTGLHVEVECAQCHQGAQTPADLQSAPQDCVSCHRMDDPHEGGLGEDCAVCHSPDGWLPAEFDHTITGFELVGEHAALECQDCHTGRAFEETPSDCFSCHESDDAHQGRFGAECGTCHTPDGWTPASFDHDLSGFSLTGAHSDVACLTCHDGGAFEGTPNQCAGCHADPAFHAGMFGFHCADCHSTSAWRPAAYNLPHTFPTGHGGASSCRNCHPSVLSTWTCYSCHNQAEVAEEHTEEGIAVFSDCLRCHPTGEEDEAEDRGRGDDD